MHTYIKLYIKSSQGTLYSFICQLYRNKAEKKKKNLNLGPISDFKIWGGGEFPAEAAAEL